ncbi:MAG: hypothetical protein K2N85_06205, partial [Lachnospiraceae bacterium]|nr:hypothetical protein [Lachnospiraceae bacterium]
MDTQGEEIIKPFIETCDTPEQYFDLKEQIIMELFYFLKEIVDLESEMSLRLRNYDKLVGEGSLTREQMHHMCSDIFAEHEERRRKIAEKKCTKEFLEKYLEPAVSSPPKYNYVVSGCEKCVFTMNKPKQALVVVEYRKGETFFVKDRFRLKKEENKWKICAFNVWSVYD